MSADAMECAGCGKEIEADTADVKHAAWYLGRPYHRGCYYRIPSVATIVNAKSIWHSKLRRVAES